MLKNDFIKIKVSSGLKQNYSNLDYDFSNSEILFKITDLKDVSNQRVDVLCDICNDEYNLQYCKYIKNIKRNGFYSCRKCANKRRSEDMKINNLSLNKEYQKKKKETFNNNYGVDNPSKSDVIKQKKIKTCLENYGVESGLMLRDKVKEGMTIKYGVEHPLMSDEIKSKVKKTILDRYDVENISELDCVKQKKKETCLRNYGVIYPAQNPEIFKKQLISSFKIINYNEDLYSQGSYELDFLNYCKERNILNLISNGVSLKYILGGKEHVYHSDFYIKDFNLIIEIKSHYTYEKELEKNLAKEYYSKLNGYNFLFIIDKNYNVFDIMIK